MRKPFKQLASLSVVLFYALIAITPASETNAQAVIDEEYLPIQLEYQQTLVWCWVAAAKMIAEYYNVQTPSQCQMLQSQYGAPCCSNPNFCTRPGQIQEIAGLIQNFGLRYSTLGPPTDGWSLLSVFKQGRPIVLWVNGSHFVVASGMKVVATSNGPLGIVHILDPYYGEYDEPLPSLYQRWGAALYVY